MRIGIIGAGKMGKNYAQKLTKDCGIHPHDMVIHDLVHDKATGLADEFDCYSSDEFPTDIDAAIIAANTPSHHRLVVQLAQQGVKHILCEKPLAQSPTGLQHILDNVGDSSVYTGLVINFSPALAYLIDKMQREELMLIEFDGQWGKNRGVEKEKRPTPGDLEDEAIHPLGVLFALASVNGRQFVGARVTGQLGWFPYANEEAQSVASANDSSFPKRPNHSTSASLRLYTSSSGAGTSLNAHVHSSFLATEEIRTVSGTLGLQNSPIYRFTIRFDQKRAEGGGTVDILKIVRIKSDEAEVFEFPNDKLGDLTKAFVSVVHGNTPDPRLATVRQAGALVRIADAILQSDQKDGQPVHVQLD